MGVPMVVRTWQQACLCKTLSKVIVATDDERIAAACREEGAEVVMTSVSCANGALLAALPHCCSCSAVRFLSARSTLFLQCLLLISASIMPGPCTVL